MARGLVRSAEPAESLPDAGQRGNFYVNARDARISIVDKGDVGAGTDGYAAQVTSTVEEITGAPARPLERLLEELPTSAGD